MGLIVEIGNRALRRACQECRRWPGDTDPSGFPIKNWLVVEFEYFALHPPVVARIENDHVRRRAVEEYLAPAAHAAVAVNFSSIQFEHSDVPALVRETLAATNLSANRLEIEITESTLLQNTIRTCAHLQQLAEAGVKISLDDFRTAYSGLSYLHTFPLHKVKFDRSFLQDLHDDERRSTLLRGLTRLSAQLGLRVVVEGVETDEQLELLAAEDSIDEILRLLTRKAHFPTILMGTRSSSLPALGSPAPLSQWTRTNFCEMQTWLFIGRKPRVVARGAGSKGKWRPMPERA